MRLVRYGAVGAEKPGVLDAQGVIRDVSSLIPDWAGVHLGPESFAKLQAADLSALPKVEGAPRLGSCVAQPGNFIAVGLNYADHAAETGAPIPSEPILFNKAPNCVVGPNDDVMLPKTSTKADWEVELAIIIGKRASNVSEADALRHVAGYCVCHDVSERQFQIERQGQWTKGKGCPTFGPLGPWLVTPDEIPNISKLGMWLDVNGERMQTGSTATMIFGVATLVSYISEFMALDPGDVITTGTPPGVGLGFKPPRFLKAGDKVRLGIDHLGEQAQTIVAWRAEA